MSLHSTAAAIGAIDYAQFYTRLGVPPQLAHLAAEIEKHEPVLDDLSAALERKADLTLVWPKFALWLLADGPLAEYKTSARVVALYRHWIAGKPPKESTWRRIANSLEFAPPPLKKEASPKTYAAWAASYTAVVNADPDEMYTLKYLIACRWTQSREETRHCVFAKLKELLASSLPLPPSMPSP